MKKFLKVFGITILAITVFITIINVIPPKKNVESNPFIIGDGDLPMIAAHRGGGVQNPENTMLAFREAVKTVGIRTLSLPASLSEASTLSVQLLSCSRLI